MTDVAPMEYIEDLAARVTVEAEATVSRTVLKAEGVRLVLFSFDTGQELSEHTAAVPVILQVPDGCLEVTADGRTVRLGPGGVIHLPSRMPHAVVALEPSRMVLMLLDSRSR